MKKVKEVLQLAIKKIKSKEAKRISSVTSYALIGIFLLLILITISSKFPLANHQLLTVLSGSMEPKIKAGSLILVKSASDYQIGDIITFQGKKKFPTTHRIKEITSEGYVTQGDANNAPDLDKVPKETVLGKALFPIPYLGYAVNFSQKKEGFALIIIVPALLIIIGEIFNIQKEARKVIQRKKEKKKPNPASKIITPKEITKVLIFILGSLSFFVLREIKATNAYFSDQAKIEGFEVSTWTVGPGAILINEFLPNPPGADNASMPNGEWVELYNTLGVSVDLAGWMLYDSDDTHQLPITSSNTNTGNTQIAPGGFLVVYRNGDTDFALNNTGGDSVRLYDQAIPSGTLIDSHTYTINALEGKSFARIPDGSANWVDPIPTPGKPNVLGDENIDFGPALPEPGEENYEETPSPEPESLPLPEPSEEEQETESSSDIPTQEENENLENNESENGEDTDNPDNANLDIVSDCAPAISEIEGEDPNPEDEESEEEGENQQEEMTEPEVTEPEVTEPEEGNLEQESPEPALDNSPSSDNTENNEEETEGEITENGETPVNEEPTENNQNSNENTEINNEEPETNP